jgi:hypothetical protein
MSLAADVPTAEEASPQVGGAAVRPDVSILIVGFNSAALIPRTIAAIPSACTRYTYEVLLVDNGDGSTAQMVAGRFPDVRIMESRGNIGFAAGNNLLAEQAKAEFLLLLNPDMVPLPGSIDHLIEGACRYPEGGAWGGVTVNAAGEPDTGNELTLPTLKELAGQATGRARPRNYVVKGIGEDAIVDVLCGGFVMFPLAVWQEAGGFDERYFLYSEEVDLFLRLRQMGYRVWRIAAAHGYHEMGHGVTFSPTRMLLRSAGMMQFARLHWSPPKRELAFVLIWFSAMSRYLAGTLLGWRKPRLAQLRDGYRQVALKPHFWRYGYHPQRGLRVRMGL